MILRGSFAEQTAAEKEKRVNMENKKTGWFGSVR